MKLKHMTSRTKIAFAVAGVLVISIVGVGTALGTSTPHIKKLKPKAATKHASSAALKSFPVLRSGRSAAAIPATVTSQIASDPLLKSNGGNPALGVLVPTAASGNVLIVPGTNSVCLYAQDPRSHGPGGTCSSLADAQAGKLVLWFTDEQGKNVQVFALVPDGVKANVTNDSGSTDSVPVANNVVAFNSPAPQSLTVGSSTTKF